MPNYYCVYCGAKYSAINLLTLNLCPRNPENPRGNHKLYEGSEKLNKQENHHIGFGG